MPLKSSLSSACKSSWSPAFHAASPCTTPARARKVGATGIKMVTQEMAEAVSLLASTLSSTDGSSMHLAFADQGGNLAGKFFQASLLPYLGFLYWLQTPGNGTPKMSMFGFRFLLLFVIATIPTGIISKTAFGVSLADVDWLHGGAELLLTVTNLLVVYGFRQAMSTGDTTVMNNTYKNGALAILAAVAALAATGIPQCRSSSFHGLQFFVSPGRCPRA